MLLPDSTARAEWRHTVANANRDDDAILAARERRKILRREKRYGKKVPLDS